MVKQRGIPGSPQALVSIVHVWSRILSIKKILRSMPKPYMPTKQIDVPRVSRDVSGIERGHIYHAFPPWIASAVCRSSALGHPFSRVADQSVVEGEVLLQPDTA